MKVEVVLKDMDVKENGAKALVDLKYSLAHLKTRLQWRCLWTEGSCWGRGIKFELVAKAWACKFIFFASFPIAC